MEIRVSDDLDRLSVWADPAEQETILGVRNADTEPVLVHSFDDPMLLTDTAAICRLRPGLRDTLFSLYASYPRRVTFRGVSVDWSPDRYPRVWCPSIDTVFFARAMLRQLDGVRSFAEIGTGSGFLSKFVLHHATIDRAVASDISLAALRCADDATAGMSSREIFSLLAPHPHAPDLGLTGRYDLIFSNPPYIPRPAAMTDNAYEGLEVVRKLAEQADRLLNDNGKIVLNLSSLSGPEPLKWFQDRGLIVTAHEQMRVPLKINAVSGETSQESRDWMAFLRAAGRLDEEDDQVSGYRYWHTLRMFTIARA